MKTWQLTLLCIFTVLTPALTVQGQLPDARIVCLQLHENPNDPESAVSFVIDLSISAVDMIGSQVGWEVSQITITRFHDGPQTWSEGYPMVGTSDGLWWTDHADPSAPEIAEFTQIPAVSGSAQALDSEVNDLNYDISQGNNPNNEADPYPVTARTTYSFQCVAIPIPEGEDEDEPVEIDDGYTDPN